MKKSFLIVTIVFAILAVLFLYPLIYSSVEERIAINHYYATSYKSYAEWKTLHPRGEAQLGKDYGYGCGDIACKYCNGEKNQISYGMLIYSATITELLISSASIFSISGFISILFLIFAYTIPNRKERLPRKKANTPIEAFVRKCLKLLNKYEEDLPIGQLSCQATVISAIAQKLKGELYTFSSIEKASNRLLFDTTKALLDAEDTSADIKPALRLVNGKCGEWLVKHKVLSREEYNNANKNLVANI